MGYVHEVGRPSLYKKAKEKWGVSAQLGMMQEECAELIAAINKGHRREFDDASLDLITSEIADVEIMMEQARVIFNPSMIEEHKRRKLERLQERLDKEL